MKKIIASIVSWLLTLLCLVACTPKADLWQDATYGEDMTFGDGTRTVVVEVAAGDRQVTFTVKTDKATVGDALLEHGLIDGEECQFGMYIKSVNGIVADYDVDGTYWAFYIDGEYAMSGVDGAEITEGAVYRLARERG